MTNQMIHYSLLYKDCSTVKNRTLYKFETTNNNLEKSMISDMHHGISYIYINFQQNRVSRLVKTVHITLFAKNHKLHKFATTNSNLFKNRAIQTCIIVKRVYIYIYEKFINRLEVQ